MAEEPWPTLTKYCVDCSAPSTCSWYRFGPASVRRAPVYRGDEEAYRVPLPPGSGISRISTGHRVANA
eukprot:1739354-Rhodomonas_salina.1